MIDTNQLSALVSAFRVETEKESISPETVGKLLQDILDLLTTASSDTERKILDNWKALLSQYTVVYDVAHATGMADMEHMFLTLKGRSLRNGASFTSSVPLYGATDLKAGIMTAAHVQAIMALQSSLPQVRSAVTAQQTTVQQHGWQLSAIQAAAYVVTDIKQGVGNANKIFLSLTKHDVRTGEDFPNLGTCQIAAATANQAGAMTAAHVTSLANAKTDITALQSAMRKVQGAATVVNGVQVFHIALDKVGIMLMGYNLATGEREIEHQSFYLAAASQYGAGVMTAQHVKQLDALRKAVFGEDGYSVQRTYFPLAIEINKGTHSLILHGALALVNKGYTPYLFRYSKKRNRRISTEGIKDHGVIRKGWNVVGKADTITIGQLDQVKIRSNVFKHPDIDTEGLQSYQIEARFFVKEQLDEKYGVRYVSFGKSKIDLELIQEDGSKKWRKVRLLYGIAFADYAVGKRDRLLPSHLVTPIIPFHVATEYSNGEFRWIFEK